MTEPTPLPYCPSAIAEQLLAGSRRVLLYGETGIGKSMLAAELARQIAGTSLACFGISADPGSPGFGLPGHGSRTAGELAERLLTVTPGEKLVYATDLADTAANRAALAALAHRADFMFCEAAFMESDITQAERTGHLTAQACGEIANQADVKQLVPFHFSKRYEGRPGAVYDEVSAVCSRVVSGCK